MEQTMSLTVAVIANVSLMATLITGLTYVMRLPYHLQSPAVVGAISRSESRLPKATRMEPVPFAPHPQLAYRARRSAKRADGEADDVLATVQRMIDGDYEQWHEEWIATADRIADRASQASSAGRLEHEDVAS
jgi:hypothetical protein